MMKREVRTFSGAQMRAKAQDKPGVDGYAAVFNSPADIGWFSEVIMPGAFARAIKEKQDVRCLQNHDSNLVLGRTKNNTLALKEDEHGLQFSCDFPNTQPARDLSALLDRGDIDQCSFGFIVTAQSWREEKKPDGDVQLTREIEDVDLLDVSPVTFPAYGETSCEGRSALRSLWPDGMPAEVRSHRAKRDDQCECECPECQDGDCDDCSDESCTDEHCRSLGRSRKAPSVAINTQVEINTQSTEDVIAAANAATAEDVHGEQQHKERTKTIDGEELKAEDFIIVGDPLEPKTWSLPAQFATEAKTQSHLRNALARFNQVKGLTVEVRAACWATLVSRCQKHALDISEKIARHLTQEQLLDLRAPQEEDTKESRWLKSWREAAEQMRISVTESLELIHADQRALMASCRSSVEEVAQLCAEVLKDEPREAVRSADIPNGEEHPESEELVVREAAELAAQARVRCVLATL